MSKVCACVPACMRLACACARVCVRVVAGSLVGVQLGQQWSPRIVVVVEQERVHPQPHAVSEDTLS